MTKALLIAVLAAALMTGCAAHVNHPGTANSFDSDSYDTLLVTNTTIVTTKSELAQGAFTSDQSVLVKQALNQLINAYDIADSAYLVYHAAAMAGTATPAQQATVQSDLAQVNAATNSLVSVRGAK